MHSRRCLLAVEFHHSDCGHSVRRVLLARAAGRAIRKAASSEVLQQTGKHPTGGSERKRYTLQELLLVTFDAHALPVTGFTQSLAPAIDVSTDCSIRVEKDFLGQSCCGEA